LIMTSFQPFVGVTAEMEGNNWCHPVVLLISAILLLLRGPGETGVLAHGKSPNLLLNSSGGFSFGPNGDWMKQFVQSHMTSCCFNASDTIFLVLWLKWMRVTEN
jgi:hypothetical protein